MAQVKRSCSSLAGIDWNVYADELSGGSLSLGYDKIAIVLQWEILQELKQLNRLLNCRNFTSIPKELRGLRRDLKAARKEKG